MWSLLTRVLAVTHNRVELGNWATIHVVIHNILQEDFQMQLTGTGNNVLATLLSVAQHQRLVKPLKAFNKLGKINCVLDV